MLTLQIHQHQHQHHFEFGPPSQTRLKVTLHSTKSRQNVVHDSPQSLPGGVVLSHARESFVASFLRLSVLGAYLCLALGKSSRCRLCGEMCLRGLFASLVMLSWAKRAQSCCSVDTDPGAYQSACFMLHLRFVLFAFCFVLCVGSHGD